MASTTRVEKLQYKEIMTPAWREMTITAKERVLVRNTTTCPCFYFHKNIQFCLGQNQITLHFKKVWFESLLCKMEFGYSHKFF